MKRRCEAITIVESESIVTIKTTTDDAIRYVLPRDWIQYDLNAIAADLIEAKTAIRVLTSIPYQRNWVEALQELQLKREVAGTSRIEGADFTEGELDVALKPNVTPEELVTKSQRQANSAVKAYRWIATVPGDKPIDQELIKEIHWRIVTGCDDDHCEPGTLRSKDHNVSFGIPRHRGCEGGRPCQEAFDQLTYAIQHEFRGHDLLVQALATHYHFAAMHPFADGNGRTARALEALMLQRADLTDRAFIAMSDYYHDEKNAYLKSLSAVRALDHDLTQFLKFGLRGIAVQASRLCAEIKKNMERALFRDLMYNLFNRLESTRKRVIKDRQIEILKILLDTDQIDWHELRQRVKPLYKNPATFDRTIIRDVTGLIQLGAIGAKRLSENKVQISLRPQWPQEITEGDFFETVSKLPKGKTYTFLR